MQVHQKIFGIGMNKTGTTSLKKCFRILSLYPVAPTPASSREINKATRRLFKKGDYEPALKFAERYRSFEDRPWNIWEMYQHLDRRFPDSRFILTVRDPETWWRSVERWITFMKPRMAEKYRIHLRSPSLCKGDMIKGYLRYNDTVMDYFENRQNMLVVDFEKGDGWTSLCGFLDCPVPPEPFPHKNRLTYDERDAAKKEMMTLRVRLQRRRRRVVEKFRKRIKGVS
jgi:hypothetical protein